MMGPTLADGRREKFQVEDCFWRVFMLLGVVLKSRNSAAVASEWGICASM